MIKVLVTVSLSTSLMLCSHAALAQNDALKLNPISSDDLAPYIANYNVVRDGDVIGKAQRRLDKLESGQYSLEMRAEASLLFYSMKTCERSQFNLIDGKLQAQTYLKTEKRTFKNKKKVSLEFDVQNGVIHGSENKKSWDIPYITDSFDPLLVIEWLRLAAKQAFYSDLMVGVYAKDKLSDYHFAFEGAEQIGNASLGDLNGIKFTRVRENSSRRTSVWFENSGYFMPIQVQQEKDGDEQAIMVLSSFTVAPSDMSAKWDIGC